jgi:integrase-like protein
MDSHPQQLFTQTTLPVHVNLQSDTERQCFVEQRTDSAVSPPDPALGSMVSAAPVFSRSPWQNPYAERVIGLIRRECLDHLIVLNEDHLRKILKEYVHYYNESRPHHSLERNAPVPRSIEPSALGAVVAVPQVGGLHHLNTRAV